MAIIAVLLVAGIVAAGVILALPSLVRNAVADLLVSRDFHDVAVEVESISARVIVLEQLSAKTRNGHYSVGRLRIEYSRGGFVFGHLRKVHIDEPRVFYDASAISEISEVREEFSWLFEEREPEAVPEEFSPLDLAVRRGQLVIGLPGGEIERATEATLHRARDGSWALSLDVNGGGDHLRIGAGWQAGRPDGFLEIREGVAGWQWAEGLPMISGVENESSAIRFGGRIEWDDSGWTWGAEGDVGPAEVRSGGEDARGFSWEEIRVSATGFRPTGAEGWGEFSADLHASVPSFNGFHAKALEGNWVGDGLALRGRGTVQVVGIEEPFRVSQKARLGESGWEGDVAFRLAPAAVTSLAFLSGEWLPTELELTGEIRAVGDIRFDPDGHSSEWQIQWREIDATLPEHDIELRGLSGFVELDADNGAWRMADTNRFTFRSARWDEVEAGQGEAIFRLASGDRMEIERIALEWAGGELSAEDIVFNPVSPDFRVELSARGVQLGELIKLTPDFGGEAAGAIDGRLVLRVRPGGLRFEPGFLGLREGESARLRLPPRDWFTRGMSPDEPRYETMRIVEEALENLELNRFRIEFLDGPAEPPLRISIEGRPISREIETQGINLTVNVHGPVRDIGSWAFGPGLRLAP